MIAFNSVITSLFDFLILFGLLWVYGIHCFQSLSFPICLMFQCYRLIHVEDYAILLYNDISYYLTAMNSVTCYLLRFVNSDLLGIRRWNNEVLSDSWQRCPIPEAGNFRRLWDITEHDCMICRTDFLSLSGNNCSDVFFFILSLLMSWKIVVR